MRTNNTLTPNEKLLLAIIESLCQASQREMVIYIDYSQQIRTLIIDAVEKINTEFLTTLDDTEPQPAVETGHTSNLLYLLHKALDISKMLNNKINAVMHAIQIEDIAGQVIDEVFSRIDISSTTINNIQEKIATIPKISADEQKDLLEAIHKDILKSLNREKRNHVSQTNLSEGSTELF